MIYEPKTVRPDLIGKTLVRITDPFSHGNGRISPSATLGEIIVAEEEYTMIRYLGSEDGLRNPGLPEALMRISIEYDLLEPGERLEDYLPGYGPAFGTPDYVYFQGGAREDWERERAARAGS